MQAELLTVRVVQLAFIVAFAVFMIWVFIPRLAQDNSIKAFFFKDGKTTLTFFAYAFFYAFVLGHLFVYNDPATRLFFVPGAAAAVGGVLLSSIARVQLRSVWRPVTGPADVEENAVMTSGPYALVRHPIYTGRFVSFLGVTLMFNPLAVPIAALHWFFLRRSLLAEERALMLANGTYVAYAQRVGRITF